MLRHGSVAESVPRRYETLGSSTNTRETIKSGRRYEFQEGDLASGSREAGCRIFFHTSWAIRKEPQHQHQGCQSSKPSTQFIFFTHLLD